MNIVAAVLFVLAAFAGGGHELAGITWYTWLAAGFAAWVLGGSVTIPSINFRKKSE